MGTIHFVLSPRWAVLQGLEFNIKASESCTACLHSVPLGREQYIQRLKYTLKASSYLQAGFALDAQECWKLPRPCFSEQHVIKLKFCTDYILWPF